MIQSLSTKIKQIQRYRWSVGEVQEITLKLGLAAVSMSIPRPEESRNGRNEVGKSETFREAALRRRSR
jgi:hypothetical protein